MHQFASGSVQATGKYPVSSIVRTNEEEVEIDSDDDMFALDPPSKGGKPVKAKAKGNKIVIPDPLLKRQKTGSRVKSTTSVGQVTPRPTLTSPRHLRSQPKRACANRAVSEQIGKFCQEIPHKVSNGQVGYEPENIRQARSHATWPVWKAAMEKEVKGLLGRGTWTEIKKSQVPAHVKIMGSQFVFKDKLSGAKARLVVSGDQQSPKPGKHLTFSPTPSATEVRILISLATERNQPLHSCDIAQAFTQSHPLKPGEELYVRPPVGYDCEHGTVWQLKKPLYRLSIAPKAWFDTLKEFITEFGFESINCSDTFFVYREKEENIHLVFHVDDLLFSFSNDDLGLKFKAALLSRFNGTDNGPVERFVGINIK
jgi:hypothetical protein